MEDFRVAAEGKVVGRLYLRTRIAGGAADSQPYDTMILVELIYNLTLLVALSVVSGFIDLRWQRNTWIGTLLQGLLFGSAAVIGMLRPFVFAPGLVFDGRSVMISLGGLFFGPWAATVACGMTIPLRLAQGGPGALMGVLVILSSAVIGVLFHLRLARKARELSAARLFGFGVLVHLAMLTMVAALPAELMVPVLKGVGGPVLLVYPLATVLIGKILSDQEARGRFLSSLRESEARYRLLFERANDGILIMAVDGQVVSVNESFARMHGYSVREMASMNLRDLATPASAREIPARMRRLLAGEALTFEMEHHHKDGHVFPLEVSCSMTSSGGTPTIQCFHRDITERKHLETQFLRAQRMEGIGLLAGGIAHDLNNILTPIAMSTSLLRNLARDSEDRAMVEYIETNVRRGADIVRQLLTFARGQPSVRAPVAVRQLLREMDALIRETFPRNLSLEVTVAPELWPVEGDPTQIHQALMNLAINARDAMPQGGRLTLAADNVMLEAAAAAQMLNAKPGPHVCLRVSDTGVGIPAEHLERIFDPFFTTKEIGKGTGLGLPTVLGIARGHGGTVRVDSRVGRGTTFEVYLPATPEARPVIPVEPELPPRGRGELILVVDDEATVRGTVQQALERHGYRVLTASEGQEALGLLAEYHSELKAVLTDMMMPGVDGPQLVRAVRQREARLPIIGMTGLTESMTGEDLKNLNLAQMLAKPFEARALLVAVHRALAAPGEAAEPGR